MGKLKLDKKALERFVVERTVLDQQIGDYEDNKNRLYEGVIAIENEMADTKKANENMKFGHSPMDAVAYLENENKLLELADKLAKAKADYNTFSRVGEKLKEDVYTPLLNNKGDVDHEFKDNAIAIQKEMFKALKTVEEMCGLLNDLSAEYREEFRYIPHSQAQYCNFYHMPFVTTVLNRFGIMNRSSIEYSTNVTSELYEFEK